MKTPLTAETLRGIWPALLTPWTEAETVDEDAFAAEVRSFAQAGVHGVYTGGTAGEFYAQDEATFQQITELVCEAARPFGLPVQIGCTALSTRTVRRRIEVARHAGADGIQVALPFWLPLSDEEVLDFFDEIADAAGEVPLVLYHSGRAKRRIGPDLLARLCGRTPTLIGVKDTVSDEGDWRALRDAAPGLSFFGPDHRLLDRIRSGGRGTYSSLAGLNPKGMVRYHELCDQACWEEAATWQSAAVSLMEHVLLPMVREEGLWDSAVDRIQRVAGGGRCGLRCAGPYRSGTGEHVQRLHRWCRGNAPRWLPESIPAED